MTLQETGTVISLHDEMIKIKFARNDHCKTCKLCDTFGSGSMCVMARNNINAEVGDQVRVHIEPGNVVKNAFIIFIFPLFMMFTGYFIGQSLDHALYIPQEECGILGAFLFFFISLGLLKLYDNSVSKRKQTVSRITLKKIEQST